MTLLHPVKRLAGKHLSGKMTVTTLAFAALTGLLTGCPLTQTSNPPTTSLPDTTTAPSIATATPTQPQPMGTMASNMGHMDHASMDLGPADADYDLRFIDAMTPHHQGAIVMAKEAIAKSKEPKLQALAQDIITAQETEIAQMKTWRSTWYPSAPATPMAWHAAMGHMMAMTPEQTQAMAMTMDLGAADAGFDKRFLAAMVPHHQGALVMAKEALQKSKRPEIQQLAQAILKSQQAEIEQMKQWQQQF